MIIVSFYITAYLEIDIAATVISEHVSFAPVVEQCTLGLRDWEREKQTTLNIT